LRKNIGKTDYYYPALPAFPITQHRPSIKNHRKPEKQVKPDNNNPFFQYFFSIQYFCVIFALQNFKNRMEYGKLSELARRVVAGTATIARLDKAEELGRIAGGIRNVEATIVLGTAFGYYQGEQNGTRSPINEQSAQQKAVLTAYADEAMKNGVKLWCSETDIEEIKQKSIAQSGGAEADVYFMPDGNVIKVVEHYGTPLEFLDDRISLYNYLFPGTKYELLGFTDNPYDADYVSFIVSQKEIEGGTFLKQLKDVSIYDLETRKEAEIKLYKIIEQHLKEKFDAVPSITANTYSNSNYIIRDLHFENVMTVGNVLANPKEHLYIIDANVSLNTDKQYGGKREYFPFYVF
jgi:hypothetical protein